MAKIISDPQNSIPVGQMKDGEIGLVIKWQNDGNVTLNQTLVQRFEHKIILLNCPSGRHYPLLLTTDEATNGECMVRILAPGTVIEL